MSNGAEFRIFTKEQERELILAHGRAQQNGGGDRVARLKLFGLGKLNSWTWLLSEYDPDARCFFGLVESAMCPGGEWGYVDREEVESRMNASSVMRGAWIERDLYFSPVEVVDAEEPANG